MFLTNNCLINNYQANVFIEQQNRISNKISPVLWRPDNNSGEYCFSWITSKMDHCFHYSVLIASNKFKSFVRIFKSEMMSYHRVNIQCFI